MENVYLTQHQVTREYIATRGEHEPFNPWEWLASNSSFPNPPWMLGYKGLIIRSLQSPVDSWVKGNTAVHCDLLTGCLLLWCRTVDDLRAPASASHLVHPAPPSDPSQDCRSVKAQNCSIKDYIAAYLWDCCSQIIAICTLTNVWFHSFWMCNWLTCTVPFKCTAAPPCTPSTCNKCELHVLRGV